MGWDCVVASTHPLRFGLKLSRAARIDTLFVALRGSIEEADFRSVDG